MKRVLVTGVGCISPYGVGERLLWEGLAGGRSALGPLTAFDPTPYGCQLAGEVRDFEPTDFLLRREITGTARAVQMGLAAARMALASANLELDTTDTTRAGVFVGTSIGTWEYAEEAVGTFLEKGIRRVHPFFPAQAYPGVVATQIGISLKVRGPVICLSTACTSAADAIGMAWQQIRSGVVDRAVVGGTETPLSPMIFASFDRLGAMSKRNDSPSASSRPFDDDRDGFVMSEGAAMFVLESEASAQARGVRPLAEIVSYDATSDIGTALSPSPLGEGGENAIRRSLELAGIVAGDVGAVFAHAIGSVPNDPVEAGILHRVFGERGVPITAIKSMLGHSMGAGPAFTLLSTIGAFENSSLPPTINVDPRNSLPLDLVTDRNRPLRADTILDVVFGFGSRNAAIVVQRVSAA